MQRRRQIAPGPESNQISGFPIAAGPISANLDEFRRIKRESTVCAVLRQSIARNDTARNFA
jgi:hypothetical protein